MRAISYLRLSPWVVLFGGIAACDPGSSVDDGPDKAGTTGDTGTAATDTDTTDPGDTDTTGTDSDTTDTDTTGGGTTDTDTTGGTTDTTGGGTTDTGTGGTTGTDTGTPYQPPPCVMPGQSIQVAIDAAPAGGTVTVCAGTYDERLSIAKSLTLVALDGAAATIVDAKGLGSALRVTAGTVVVDGFTFQNGFAITFGGDVACDNADLTLTDSVLSAGYAPEGGGFGASGCTGAVTGTTITGSSATDGAGVHVVGDGLAISESTITGNTAAGDGGGVYIDGTDDVVDNLIDGNVSDNYGGGLFVVGGSGDIARNTVSNNSSVNDGGGMYIDHGDGVIDANTVVDNYSDDDGGGVRLKLSEYRITNNVISRNLATNIGGGARLSHQATTVSGNTFDDNEAYWKGGGLALFESASDVTDNVFTSNHAPHGGGIWISGGWDDVLIEDCTLDGNSAGEDGGNLFANLVGFSVILHRVEILDGEADIGGGVYALETNLVFDATSIAGNTAWSSGGGAYIDTTTGALTNGVVYGNDSGDGAGLLLTNGVAGLSVENTIVQGNTSGAGVRLASGLAPDWRYNDVYGNPTAFDGMADPTGGSGNLSVDAGFVNAAAGDLHLGAGSPLIDAGDPTILDTNGSRSDMGRYGGPFGG